MTIKDRSWFDANGAYRYGFNGKEQDNDMGNTAGAIYDYGFRIYDARIAKFTSVDPLAPEYPFWSPYHFAGLNPIKFIDLDGKEPTDPQLYWTSLPELEVKLEGENRSDVSYYSTVGIHSNHEYFRLPGKMIVAQTYYLGQPTRSFYWDVGIKGWVEFDPHGIGLSADQITTIATYTFAATGAIVSGLIVAGEIGWGVLVKEVGKEVVETTIEELTGIPIIISPLDLAEQGLKKLIKKQVKGKLVEKYGKEALKGHGSYTIVFESGKKYHGKGSFDRAVESANDKFGEYGDMPTNIDWTPSKSSDDAFIDEYKRLKNDGGSGSGNNYNKIESPGKKKLEK
tara:strand:+ start:28732 stop:29751 length:1020 start_codon:yes stop_codon:yes gene_type:complete